MIFRTWKDLDYRVRDTLVIAPALLLALGAVTGGGSSILLQRPLLGLPGRLNHCCCTILLSRPLRPWKLLRVGTSLKGQCPELGATS